tara:strand:- start:558 stop:1082 length:525 start_codon:yes stop_codon:yes gene_type:complete
MEYMSTEIRSASEAMTIFKILGIEDITTDRQRKNGTQVFELPIKQMYNNLVPKPLRFATYESGYVRNVSEHNSSSYQINKTKKRPADNNYHFESIERILIAGWENRLIYLARFIIKNYYQKPTYLISDYTLSTLKLKNQHDRLHDREDKLPFTINRYPQDDVQVIVNGHRYNLS